MLGALPQSVTLPDGTEYAIRTDFRDVLSILEAFSDPDLENEEKVYVCLYILYKDFPTMPKTQYESAFKAAMQFIDCGVDPDDKSEKKTPHTMDWVQDERLIFPAVNHVAGMEVRSVPYLHWWTFYGYFMEIHDGVFANVLALRQKKATGKKLEKWEREFWQNNTDICELKVRLSEEEKEAKKKLLALLDG